MGTKNRRVTPRRQRPVAPETSKNEAPACMRAQLYMGTAYSRVIAPGPKDGRTDSYFSCNNLRVSITRHRQLHLRLIIRALFARVLQSPRRLVVMSQQRDASV